MRIFFISGFGEEVSIFDKIRPFIPGEKVFIDNWTLLADVPENGLNVQVYAQYLIKRFQIKKEDVVIGHSMGGWIGLHVKQLTGCRIVQIASWTNLRKIICLPIERHLMYWLAKKGFGFNPLVLRVLIWLYYENKPSREVFIAIFERIRMGDKSIAAKQLMVIFNPVKEPAQVSVDVRIHSKKDHIVKPPDQDFYCVPGDHFSLYTFPHAVSKPIAAFFNGQQ